MRVLACISVCALIASCSNNSKTPAGLDQAAAGAGASTTTAAGNSSASTAGMGTSSAGMSTTGAANANMNAIAGASGVDAAGVGDNAGGAGQSAGAAGSAGSAGATDRSGAAGSAGEMAAAGSTAGEAGASGQSGAAGATGSSKEIMGCGDSTLLELPEDTAQRGPWPVGEKTVSIGRLSAVEVFYPAMVGSEAGKDSVTFDLRTFLPKSEQSKVPDAEATIVSADTYRDLPLDEAHGPYPVVIMVHGTASFRVGSFHTQALWASRGFVVVAADHPGLYLADYLATNGCNQTAPAEDLSGDMDAEINALASASGDLAFLSGHIDMARLALGGHSAGAVAVAQASTKPGVEAVIALAGTRAVSASSTLKSVLFVAGMSDQVLAYSPGEYYIGNVLYPGSDTAAYNGSPGPSAVKKRLIGITNGGHLNVTDLCNKNAQNKSDLEVSQAHGVCGISNVAPLADCGSVDTAKSVEITNAATTAVLEETLQCQDRSAVISGLKDRYPEIGDFKQAI